MCEEKAVFDFEKMICIKKHFSKFMAEHGSDEFPPAFCIFAEALLERDFSSQQELSDLLEVNKAHTSRTLFKMHAKGLIKLEPKLIHLTDKGREYAKKSAEKKQQYIAQILDGVSEEERQTLAKIVNKIVDNTKKLEEEY